LPESTNVPPRVGPPLPRDERGLVWPEDAIEALKEVRALVREQHTVSIEAALRGQALTPDPSEEAYPTPGGPQVPKLSP
jgi:hypothetical protein